MGLIQIEKELSKLLSTGIFFISVAVITSGLTDPVNVPKLLLLGLFSMGCLGLLINSGAETWSIKRYPYILALIAFLLISLFASLRSDSPFSQNIYGTYGRNNGFLTYLFLSILLFSAATFNLVDSHLRILKSLIYVGYVNLIYCTWVLLFGDFIPWNNIYGNILGTFGNPNFIGAFFGIFFGVLVAFGVSTSSTRNFRLSLIVTIPLTLIAIYSSHAIQGRVLAILAISIIGFYLIKCRVHKNLVFPYVLICGVFGIFAVAGALQHGPFTKIIYKTSVSLRGQYWKAAWNTGLSNPVDGIGMDSFGDWYRRSRDIRAIELPGVNTVVNTAHNVALDMFAFGGWPLFLTYLLLVGVAFKSLISISKRMKKYDSIGVALISAWICYQVQSIISINQIGLAVWGWVLSGSLISYDKLQKIEAKISESPKLPPARAKLKRSSLPPKAIVYSSTFALIGMIISIPPVVADTKLRKAQFERKVFLVEQSLDSNIFNPANSQKFIVNIQALEASGFLDLSHKYAQEAVKWNPESFDLWMLLYLVKNTTPEEREIALQNLKRLDPLNPDLISTQ